MFNFFKKIKKFGVDYYFDYLYERGYKNRQESYVFDSSSNWVFGLQSQNNIIEICCDRNEILIYFMPLSGDRKYRISLQAMIYLLTNGKKFVGFYEGNRAWNRKKQLENTASLLKEYIEKIEPYFGSEIMIHSDELLLAQRKYFDLVEAKFF